MFEAGSTLGWYGAPFWHKPAASVLTGKRKFVPGVAKTHLWLEDPGCGYDLADARSVSHLHQYVRPAAHQPALWTANGITPIRNEIHLWIEPLKQV